MSGAALCQKEVERLHEFFVDWFTGKLEQTPEHLEEHCMGRFSDDFCMVNPLGRLISKPQLVTGLTHAYNSHPEGNVFEIHIHNCHVLQHLPSSSTTTGGQLKLVSYEEWQRTGAKSTVRQSTALLHIMENDDIEWKYVHETWLEGKGPNDINVEMVAATATATSASSTEGRPSTKPAVATLISPRRHVSENLAGAKAVSKQGELMGLDFRGISLQTTQGPMANEVWLDESTKRLEDVCQSTLEKRKRRLNLPEVCFSQATVEVKLPNVKLAWNVFDALHEWSVAHASIPIGSETVYRGVSVLKSVDAVLWSNKAVQTDFHYDWTYSSPFSVKTTSDDTITWKPLPASGMNINLLKDTTQPILYYDEIELYEDDLHDNGVVNFRIKLRLMPTCLYVLSRCWVRVDALLLQCRETRLMVEFAALTASKQQHTVYRDITWRQCAWSDLPGHNLPTDVRVWKNEGTTETPAWNALVNRLPVLADLPEGLNKHGVLEVSSATKDDVSMES